MPALGQAGLYWTGLNCVRRVWARLERMREAATSGSCASRSCRARVLRCLLPRPQESSVAPLKIGQGDVCARPVPPRAARVATSASRNAARASAACISRSWGLWRSAPLREQRPWLRGHLHRRALRRSARSSNDGEPLRSCAPQGADSLLLSTTAGEQAGSSCDSILQNPFCGASQSERVLDASS